MLETKKYFSREFFVFAWKCPKTQRKSIFKKYTVMNQTYQPTKSLVETFLIEDKKCLKTHDIY